MEYGRRSAISERLNTEASYTQSMLQKEQQELIMTSCLSELANLTLNKFF